MVNGMLAVAWAVLTGIGGYLAACGAGSTAGSQEGHALGLFFFGPLGSVVGFVAAERALKPPGRSAARVVLAVLLPSLLYAGLVYAALVMLLR